ncbi:MAG: hypothetical protein KAR40_11150 [Candidatus Sabulitectum sp.]|nr:hypothetical protein [Candidatus Sabulitectum sp.]
MADTLLNIPIPENEWVDLYDLSGIAVGTAIQVQNVGINDVYLVEAATQPDVDFDGYNVVSRANGNILHNETGASGAWAYCSAKSKLNVGLIQRPRAILTDENKVLLELDPLVKSIPVTETFHHLGHEGKLFIHSDRHNGIANADSDDYLIRIPAGNANRQVHMRFNFIGKAITGTLDVDIILYKDATISADGDVETIVSTNDAVVKTTGVLIFHMPTIINLGTFKSQTMMAGTKKSASSKEQIVPEWILAPDGVNERNYIIRITNNSGGDIDVVNSIFFYDSEAA